MNGSETLINLIGGVALLLWGLRMVRTGVTRAWGGNVQRWLGLSLGNRLRAFATGLGVTLLLQSSSATALLAASFAGRGLVETAPALAVLLGADVGTALVAQLLSFDLSVLSPLLITAGVAMFMGSGGGRVKDIGRLVVGLGLMLLALKLIVGASMPMRSSEVMQTVLASLGNDVMLSVLLGAAIAWLAHSSLATVLLIMSLAIADVVPLAAAFAMVLGANIGGAFPPLVANWAAGAEARRPPLGNLLFRLLGVALVLPFLPQAINAIPGTNSGQHVVNFHFGFNVLLAIIFLPLITPMATITRWLQPQGVDDADAGLQPAYLDVGALDTPPAALANATRETQRMGELLEKMLAASLEAISRGDSEMAKETRRLDDGVDRFHNEIRLYLTHLNREPMGDEDSNRSSEILAFTTNLEHIGDIISVNLLDNTVRKKLKDFPSLHQEQIEKIESLFEPVFLQFRRAFTAFASGDATLARELVDAKAAYRELGLRMQDEHLDVLGGFDREALKFDSLQQDILRDLKRINSHLTSAAYPILEASGELRKSRLKKPGKSRNGKSIPQTHS